MTRIGIFPVAATALLLGLAVASAQTTTPGTTNMPGAGAATTGAASKVTLTDAQAKTWIDKPVFSSDNQEIGEVSAFKRGSDNVVTELHADLGGMMGMGETRVKLMPEQFKLQNDRVILNMTREQARNLPKVQS
ncbi:MAG: hypothetical protein NW223_21235 [Hyphomicrobiaceae bacterium]|nr:hypothetical protein [Hyphomicrobiaceae bacterium]